jgi:hypothetical protein
MASALGSVNASTDDVEYKRALEAEMSIVLGEGLTALLREKPAAPLVSSPSFNALSHAAC